MLLPRIFPTTPTDTATTITTTATTTASITTTVTITISISISTINCIITTTACEAANYGALGPYSLNYLTLTLQQIFCF